TKYSEPLSIVPSSIVTSYKTRSIIPPPPLQVCLVGHKDFPLSIVTSVYNPHFSDFSYMPKGWDYRQGSTVYVNIFLTPQPLTFGQCPFLLFLPLTKDL